MTVILVGVDSFHVDRQKTAMAKQIMGFRNFANVPRNQLQNFCNCSVL